LVYN